VARDRAVVGASTAGDRGREVGDELIGGVGGTERDRRACERNDADKPGPRGNEREREGERTRGLAPTGGTHLSGTKGVRAWARTRGAGLNGPTWAKLAFLFSGNF
jgi:hypothetical protein